MKRLDETKWSETLHETRDVLGRDRDETRDAEVRDRDEIRDVGHFGRDETETLVRLETVSRPRRRDRDHIPGSQAKCSRLTLKKATKYKALRTAEIGTSQLGDVKNSRTETCLNVKLVEML